MARRISAIAALLAVVVIIAVVLRALFRQPWSLLTAVLFLGVAIAALAYSITRAGARRLVALIIAVVAVLVPLIEVAASGRLLNVIVLIALGFASGAMARYALGRNVASLKSGPKPGIAVEPASRPVLLMNPRSGGGKVDQFHLADEARRRGIEPVVLRPGDDLLMCARDAIAREADVIGMAGGDGSQALVASVAMDHDVAFVCVPAGTRNHLAMDLGLDRDDVVGALDAFGDAVERRIDLGMVGDRVFVNNATVGLYARIVQSSAYRDNKFGTVLDMLPAMLGPGSAPFDLTFRGPDGTTHDTAHLILVSNDRYELGRAQGFGSRRTIEEGVLGIVAARLRSAQDAARLADGRANGWLSRRPRDWLEWTDASFEIRSDAPVEIAIDGEALLLDTPIRFRTVPQAVRVRIPTHSPGYSPAAAVPTSGWSTITALLQTAAGRPVALDL